MTDTATADPRADEAQERRTEPPWLRCRRCDQRIARPDAAIDFDAGHRHHFVNPHGFEFDIALYADAPGCTTEGEPTEFFSWFPGYTWSVAHCTACRTHLGWAFECIGPPGPGEPPAFHALIPDRLA